MANWVARSFAAIAGAAILTALAFVALLILVDSFEAPDFVARELQQRLATAFRADRVELGRVDIGLGGSPVRPYVGIAQFDMADEEASWHAAGKDFVLFINLMPLFVGRIETTEVAGAELAVGFSRSEGSEATGSDPDSGAEAESSGSTPQVQPTLEDFLPSTLAQVSVAEVLLEFGELDSSPRLRMEGSVQASREGGQLAVKLSTGQLDVRSIEGSTQAVRFNADATLQLVEDKLAGSVSLRDVSGSLEDFGIAEFGPFDVQGHASLDLNQLSIGVDNIMLDGGPDMLRWEVAAGLAGDEEFLEVQVRADELDLEEFLGAIPQALNIPIPAEDVARFGDPQVNSLSGLVRIAPNQDPVRLLLIEFESLEIPYIDGLPPVKSNEGRLWYAGEVVEVQLESGSIAVGESDSLHLDDASIWLPGSAEAGSRLTARFGLTGKLRTLMEFLDMEPLRLMTEGNISKELFDAAVEASVLVKIPVGQEFDAREVEFSVTGQLVEMSSRPIFRDFALSSEQLEVVATNSEISIAGNADFGELPISLRWNMNPSDDDSGRSEASGTFQLAQQSLDVLGINLPRGTIVGGHEAEFKLQLAPDRSPRFAVNADLKALEVKVPFFSWTKREGENGQAVLTATIGQQVEIDRLKVFGDTFEVDASVSFGPNGRLQALDISKSTLGDLYGGPISFDVANDGSLLAINLLGALDFSKLQAIEGGFSLDRGMESPLDIKVRNVILTSNILASDVHVALGREEDVLARMEATINGGPRPRVIVEPIENGYQTMIAAEDAGRLLQAIGATNKIEGGQLELVIQVDQAIEATGGRLTVNDVVATDLPFLGQLLSFISITGFFDRLFNKGVSFTEVNASFGIDGDVLELERASAIGASLGIVATGSYNMKTTDADIRGKLTPLFLFSQALDATIQMDKILESEKGEGLAAVEFRVTGDANEYDIAVNPLSVVLPGQLNKID
ncbi:MAG: AsmA-like C-terminal domain-containing protein [Rhodobacteraceae bacterium]|nr:AsmA-like C-terminal domain-containing protein [Paracoccaceae bacterium]